MTAGDGGSLLRVDLNNTSGVERVRIRLSRKFVGTPDGGQSRSSWSPEKSLSSAERRGLKNQVEVVLEMGSTGRKLLLAKVRDLVMAGMPRHQPAPG